MVHWLKNAVEMFSLVKKKKQKKHLIFTYRRFPFSADDVDVLRSNGITGNRSAIIQRPCHYEILPSQHLYIIKKLRTLFMNNNYNILIDIYTLCKSGSRKYV